MIGWTIVNVASSLLVAVIIAYKLGGYRDSFNRGEALGMGMIAAGMLLRIAPMVSRTLLELRSPFDDWSVLLLHVGLAVYFCARLARVHRHWHNNDLAKRQASEHFGGVGKY